MIERLKADIQRQGADFDLLRFHDTLLYGGTMPVSYAPPVRVERPMRPRLALVGLALVLVLAACTAEPTPTPRPEVPDGPAGRDRGRRPGGADTATVTVTGAVEGEFTFELYGDQAPVATANFVALARCASTTASGSTG